LIWFVRDLDLLNLLLRAFSFALEAVAFGALFFWGVVARPAGLDSATEARLRHLGARFALALALTEVVLLATTSAELMGSGGMGLREVASAGYFISGCVFAVAALAIFAAMQMSGRLAPAVVAAVIALGASVSLSHAASRMDHRALLLALTAAHHLGMAAWVGALLFLLLSLRADPQSLIARAMARRFSRMAVVAVALLVGAGAGLSWFYAGSWRGMWGTSYGLLLSAKIVLTMMILALGAANYLAIRQASDTESLFLGRLRRFG
jgi:putative copper resistance protein D